MKLGDWLLRHPEFVGAALYDIHPVSMYITESTLKSPHGINAG